MQKFWKPSKTPLVTAVTLVYNQAPFVKQALYSMVANKGLDEEDIQYVLFDQGAPYPGVADIIKQVDEATGEWLAVFGDGTNLGVGGACNAVLESTDSVYFFKLDDDCTLYPMTLPVLIHAYESARRTGLPLAVLSADVVGVGKAQGDFPELELEPGFTLQVAPCVGGGAVLIARDVFASVGPWRSDRLYGVEDGDFAARAVAKGYFNAYLKGAYHGSFCRGPDADVLVDAWKLEYTFGKTNLPFDKWRTARAFEKKGGYSKGE